MRASPQITVLMSVYNGQAFLNQTIESVLTQDHADLEFLIVDDGSTDETPLILQGHKERDSRIRILRNERNCGLTSSLNVGLRHAHASLIARIDADDVCLAGRLSTQKAFMDANPDCMVLGSAAILIDGDGKPCTEPIRAAVDGPRLVAELFFSNPMTHSSVMFRRDEIMQLGGYDESFVRAQDYDLWLRCLGKGYSLRMLNRTCVCHRIHPGRVTVRQPASMEDARRRALSRAINSMLRIDLDDEFLDQLNHLRWERKPPDAMVCRKAIRILRLFRNGFAESFSDTGSAVDEFDDIAGGLAELMTSHHDAAVPAVIEFVGGGSYQRYALRAASLRFFQKIARVRFHIGRLRRQMFKTDMPKGG